MLPPLTLVLLRTRYCQAIISICGHCPDVDHKINHFAIRPVWRAGVPRTGCATD